MTPIQPTPVPVPWPPTQLGPLDAINELIQLPWKGYIPPYAAANIAAWVSSLEGKVVAQNSHQFDGNNGWDFALTLKDISASSDLTNPPGFSEILPIGKDGGLTAEGPLVGTWGGGFQGKLVLSSKIRVAGVDVWNVSAAAFTWSLTLGLHLQAALKIDGSAPNWPLFSHVTVTPTLGVKATEPIPFEVGGGFQFTVKPGFIEAKFSLADLSVGIGHDFGAVLDVDFLIDVTPSPTFDFLGNKVPTAGLKLGLEGTLKFSLPKQVGQVFDTSNLSASFGLDMETTIPIPEFLNGYLLLSDQKLPQQVGLQDPQNPFSAVNPLGAVKAAPPGYDFKTPATKIEAATIATHLPYGAVFSIEHDRSVNLPMWSAYEHYSDEEDSSTWTGHFLAAASFRYAATSDAAALQLVNQLLDGIDRLFNVCTDAVVKNGVRLGFPVTVENGVRYTGFFARSVLPNDSPATWWEAENNIENNNRAFYEQPEGGWDVFVDGETTLHFNTFVDLQSSLDHLPIRKNQPPLSESAIRPVGRVWYGVGAGGTFLDATTDHQLSRDQIIGMCLGLFTAWSLVSDGNVKTRTAARLTQLIGYIVQNNWNVPLPPDMKAVCTSYLGGFDHQLALLRIGATVNPAVFLSAYDRVKAASQFIWISIMYTVLDPLNDYYKMNLSHAAIVPLLMAEQDTTLRQNYFTGYNILRQGTRHHRNAWFNLASILVQLPADRATYMATTKAGSNPALLLPDEIKGILVEWLNRRKKVKEPNGLPTNAVPDPKSIMDLWNNQPTQVGPYTTLNLSTFYISEFARSVDKRAGGTMEFVWQNDSFSLGISGKPSGQMTLEEANASTEPLRECSGMDYLLPYWIAVYLGMMTTHTPPPHPAGGPD